MVEICKVCGLPKDLCACDTIAREKEQIVIKIEKKRYGKQVTVIHGIKSKKEEMERVSRELKKKLACGGTIKENEIELQGNHKFKIKDLLIELGYEEDQISIS